MKKVASLLVLLIFFFRFSSPLTAQQEFRTYVSVYYEVKENGLTQITHDVTLENVFSNLYATSYSLKIEGIDPLNPRAIEGTKNLNVTKSKEDDTTTLKVDFVDPVVGKGEKRKFKIIFEDKEVAVRTGEVWEISTPKLSTPDAFQSYSVSLSVPVSFGQEAYISPYPISNKVSGGVRSFAFNKDDVAGNGISAAFGQFQVFSFDLTYHLENPLASPGKIDIAIPPDTSFQRVNYSMIEPAPQNVHIDDDGNWLATFSLRPRERIDVKAKGTVQIFSQPLIKKEFSPEVLEARTSETEVWQVLDPEIQALAGNLPTPRAIYDYLVRNFEYDYKRVRPNVDRLGAKEALKNPKTAICMEFTDAFVAIARAAGIPAREVNGYAYTENPEIQPLSLVADVLHAWPEYWDSEKKVWIAVDPTWGSTTGGVDYFTKLDLRHFSFVMHGSDPYKPYPPGSYKLGANPQKDVFVTFGKIPQTSPVIPQITILKPSLVPFLQSTTTIRVKNTNSTALYNQELEIFLDNTKNEGTLISALPPYSEFEFQTPAGWNIIPLNMPDTITAKVGAYKVSLATDKNTLLIFDIALIFLVLFILAGLSYVLLKKRKIKDEKTHEPS